MHNRPRAVTGELAPPHAGPSYAFLPLTRTQRAARWLFATPLRKGLANLLIAALFAVPFKLFGAPYALAFFAAAGGFAGGWALARLHWQKFGDVPRL